MELFGKLPIEQAQQRLMHEQNSVIQELKFQIDELQKWSKENNEAFKSAKIDLFPFFYRLEVSRSNIKRLQKAADEHYTKFKNDFKEEVNTL